MPTIIETGPTPSTPPPSPTQTPEDGAGELEQLARSVGAGVIGGAPDDGPRASPNTPAQPVGLEHNSRDVRRGGRSEGDRGAAESPAGGQAVSTIQWQRLALV